MVRRTRSPSLALIELDRWFRPKTSGQEMNLIERFSNVKLAKGGDPMDLLMELENIAAQVTHAELRDLIHLRFLSALPSEYELEVRQLRGEPNLSMERVKTVIRARHADLQASGGGAGGHRALLVGLGGRGSRPSTGGRGGAGRGGGSPRTSTPTTNGAQPATASSSTSASTTLPKPQPEGCNGK